MVYVQEGDYKLSAAIAKKMAGEKAYDTTVSSPSSWTFRNIKGSTTISYEAYTYKPGSTHTRMVISGMEKGNIVEITTPVAERGSFYLVCGGDLSADVDILRDDTSVKDSTLDVQVGENLKLSSTVSIDSKPLEVKEEDMKWSSSDETVAKIVGNTIQLKSRGEVTITCRWSGTYYNGYYDAQYEGEATVNLHVEGNSIPVIQQVELDDANTATVTAMDKGGVVTAYGWSKDDDESTVTNWQESNVFPTLETGVYYFFVKDNQETVSDSYRVLVYTIDDITWEKLIVPTKKEYIVGEELDLTGGKLIGTILDTTETEEIALDSSMIGEYDNKTDGKKTIYVEYKDFSGQFEVTYKPDIESIKVIGYKENYFVGDEFDNSAELEIVHKNGSVESVALENADKITGFNSSKSGTCTVTVVYKGFSCTFTVKIEPIEQPEPFDLLVEIKEKDKYTAQKIAKIDVKPSDNLNYIELPNGSKVYQKVPIEYLITENGNYTFQAYSKDNQIDSEHFAITTIDNVAPIILLSYNAQLSQISINVIDNVGVEKFVMPDGRTYTSTQVTLPVKGLTTGTIIAYDKAGNIATKDFAFKEMPIGGTTVSIGAFNIPTETTTWTNQSIPVMVKAYSPTLDIESVYIKPVSKTKSSLRAVESSKNAQYTITKNGTYEYVVKIKDDPKEYKETFTVTCFDETAPTVTMTSDANDMIFQIQDDYSGIRYIRYPDGSSEEIENAETGVTSPIETRIAKNVLQEGNYSITVVDYAGNEKTVTFEINRDSGTVGKQEEAVPKQYTLTFANKEESVLFSNTHVTVKEKSAYPVIDVDRSLLPESSTFLGWTENEDGSGTLYKAGDSIVVDRNKTLYLQIEKKDTETPEQPEQPGTGGSSSGSGSSSGGSSSSGSSSSSGGDSSSGSSNENSSSDKEEEQKPTEQGTVQTLPSKTYNGQSQIVITLPKTVKGNAKVTMNRKTLAKTAYIIKDKKLTLKQSAWGNLKAGNNEVVIKVGTVQYQFTLKAQGSTLESYIPYIRTTKNMAVGNKLTLSLNNKEKVKTVKWTSSNKKIASVSQKGVITANKKGKATIKCVVTNKKGNLYKFEILVNVAKNNKKIVNTNHTKKVANSEFPVFWVDKTLEKGKSAKINLLGLAKGAKVTYTSENKAIATVKNQSIVGKKVGSTNITVKIRQNGQNYYYKFKVNVTKK